MIRVSGYHPDSCRPLNRRFQEMPHPPRLLPEFRLPLALFAAGWLACCGTDTALGQEFHLSPSGEAPDWSRLDAYQRTISRDEFLRAWSDVYYGGESAAAMSPLVEIREDRVRIAKRFKRPDDAYELFFADTPHPVRPPRFWRGLRELPPAPHPDRPLEGLRIAVDPGHLGGNWARMEHRWFQMPPPEATVPHEPGMEPGPPPEPIPAPFPVMEGEIVLRVAELLEVSLTRLGARVALVRRLTEPVTEKRPADFVPAARREGNFPPDADPATNRALASAAERMFYLGEEIRARARRINREFRPDLVLCLHVNAEPWGDPARPDFVAANHFHILVNGCYGDAEIAFDDQRCELLLRLLQRIDDEEIPLSVAVAGTMAGRIGLPPYIYPGRNARRLPSSEYVWTRNLLATRVYEAPVIFFEPYVMNHRLVHDRVQAGEYEGTREFQGRTYVNFYQEYADAVAAGVAEFYRAGRKPAVP